MTIKSMLAVCAVTFMVVFFQNAGSTTLVENASPTWDKTTGIKGSLISIQNGILTGWAFSTSDSNAVVEVTVRVDNQTLGQVRADQAIDSLSEALCAGCGRGFRMPFPPSFEDGRSHRVQFIGSDGSIIEDTTYATAPTGPVNYTGTDASESMQGSPYNDYFIMMGGDDVVRAGAGNDQVLGNLGNDTLFGEDGDDQVWGGQGDDTLWGGAGQDTLYGDIGNDTVYGEDGNDTIWGGAGDDLLFGNTGSDTIYGEDGNDTIYGGKDDDIVMGNAGNDVLYGDLGNDQLFGGRDNDVLYGGDGDDTLSGDVGDDQLFGGNGNDTYMYSSGHGNDVIDDTVGSNTLQCTDIRGTRTTTSQGVVIAFPNGQILLKGATANSMNILGCL